MTLILKLKHSYIPISTNLLLCPWKILKNGSRTMF